MRRWATAALFLVFAYPGLALAQTADLEFTIIENSPDPVVAGQDGVDYTFEIYNNGPDEATNVVGELIFNTTNGTITCDAPGSSYTPSAGVLATGSIPWQWSVPSIPAASFVTLTETCAVIGADSDDGANRSVTFSLVSLDQTDDNAANDSATEDFTVERLTNFTLSVDCTPDSIIAGSGAGNIECTLDLGQSGPSDASGVAVNLTLPSGVTVDSADTTGAPTTTFTPPTTWDVGDAAVGYSGTLVLTMTADNTATGDLTIEGSVSANETIDNGPVAASDVVAAESAADAPSSFKTTITFTNGYDGTATVTLTCNNGDPLSQPLDISPTNPATFVVTLLDFVDPAVNCQVTLDALDDGYVGSSFTANSVVTDGACLFSAAPDAGEAPFDTTTDRMNTCEIVAEPVASEFTVAKRWLFEGNSANDGSGVDQSASIWVYCSPAATNTGPSFGQVGWWVYPNGDDDFAFDFYPSPDGATCYAQESNLASEVESDQGCASGTDFEVGDTTKGCTITNTVFFEGIPTLSQWGLAVLAVLTLGTGLVGFRRFV
jgi:hypothetical protein